MSWFEFFGDEYFEGLRMRDLERDESFLRFRNNANQSSVYLLSKHRECYECNHNMKIVVYANDLCHIKSTYTYKISRSPADKPGDILCDNIDVSGEFGVYNLTFNDSACDLQTMKQPINIYLPMLTVFFLYILLFILLFGGMRLTGNFRRRRTEANIQETSKTQGKRVKAIDAFRGISIIIMIFVNLGAGGYDILDHAPWNGLHLADFVFPWFLWIMGACIPISLSSSFKRGNSNGLMIHNVTIRSVKLLCLGIFLNSGVYIDKFRFMGVLQRFGISYFIVCLICIYLLNRDLLNQEESHPTIWTGLLSTALAWIPIFCIALIHIIITFFVSFEDCKKGYLGPGGLHMHGKYEGCTGGSVGFLDRTILGSQHVYQHPTASEVYLSQAFDPEGLIGCLNSILHTFIGVQAGVVLLVYKDHLSRISQWLAWAVLTGILGGSLCGFSKEDGWIPVNKNLWSLSFVFVTSCSAFLLLTICYLIIDVKKWWQGKPFIQAGMNSILMYVGHQITSGFFPFSWMISAADTQTHFLLFLENVTTTFLWILIAIHLYKIKFFLII